MIIKQEYTNIFKFMSNFMEYKLLLININKLQFKASRNFGLFRGDRFH